jgi:hypothetical protein
MGSIVGFAAFTLTAYILIILKVPILIVPITLLTLIYLYKPVIKEVKKIKIGLNLQTSIILLVFSIGIVGQMAVISPSGRVVNGDLVFWSSHGHDGMWHIALMEEFKKGFPFQNPVFAGEKLVNYHFFSDVAPAIISKYWPGSNFNLDLDLYFRIFPFIYSLFLGISAYYLTKRITKKFSASIWAVIFTYFAGSFGYIIGKGESVFWATQIQSASGNPPQIVSDFLVLTFLYYIYDYIKNHSKFSLVFSVLILGTLAEFKVYAAIVLMGATFLTGLWQILIPGGILAAVLYLPNSSGATSFLIFQPWWYIRTMIVEPSRLNWLDEELRRQTYVSEHNWKRVISIEVVGFLIFFFGNIGMRFIGLWDFIKSGKNILKDKFNRIFILTIIISIVLPLLFLQKGVASNTGQFLQYFILLFGILAGVSTARLIGLLKFSMIRIIGTMLVIGLMVPTQYGLLKDFYGPIRTPRGPFAKVTGAEMSALEFLKNNSDTNAVILTAPNGILKEKQSIPDIWSWADTAYVAAISGRREYFADKEQVDIMGYDYKSRQDTKNKIFSSTDSMEVKGLIAETGTNFVYYPKALAPKVDLGKIGLTQILDNQEVSIWRTTAK